MQLVFVLDSVCRRLEFLKRINRALHILSALCTLIFCLVIPVLLHYVKLFLDKVTAVEALQVLESRSHVGEKEEFMEKVFVVLKLTSVHVVLVLREKISKERT